MKGISLVVAIVLFGIHERPTFWSTVTAFQEATEEAVQLMRSCSNFFKPKGLDVPAADVARLWGELHRIIHTRLQSKAASPNEVARIAWGFSQVRARPLC